VGGSVIHILLGSREATAAANIGVISRLVSLWCPQMCQEIRWTHND